MEELLSLKWNNHRSTFIHILGVLRDKQLYTDATLACDGKFYSVHKLVMSTCSDYFSAMFDKTVCKNPIIVLKDIKSEDLEALLDYMYLGEVNVKQSDLASLIKSAECLRIKGLAVPDDEPPKKPISVNKGDSSHSSSSSSINNKKSDSVLGSPPSKRRRRDEVDDGRDDVRPAHVSVKQQPTTPRPKTPPIIAQQRHSSPIPQKPIIQSPEIVRPSSPSIRQPLDTPSQSTAQADSGSNQFGTENASLVKVEMDDTGGDDMQAETYDLTNDGYKEENDDTADLSNDLPEFLQAASGSLQGSFPHSSFAGPSAYQPGDLAGWQGDGANITFPSHLNYSSSESSSQPNAPGGHERGGGGDPTGQQGCHGCPYCGKTFNWPSHLARHLRSHTGERPYACPQCSYRATQKGDLRRHLITLHAYQPSTGVGVQLSEIGEGNNMMVKGNDEEDHSLQ